mgnify:CR=1 FL=1
MPQKKAAKKRVAPAGAAARLAKITKDAQKMYNAKGCKCTWQECLKKAGCMHRK